MKVEKTEIIHNPTVMKTYISEDGKRFNSFNECRLHELDTKMDMEERIKYLDTSWYLFNNQSELDCYCDARNSSPRRIGARGEKFPIWVSFEYVDSNGLYEYEMIALSKDRYEIYCELKRMIEETQL